MRNKVAKQMLISPADYVIGKFGGLTKTANALGLTVSVVQGWKNRERVPFRHWMPLIAAAKDIGEEIEVSDFLKEHETAVAAE